MELLQEVARTPFNTSLACGANDYILQTDWISVRAVQLMH